MPAPSRARQNNQRTTRKLQEGLSEFVDLTLNKTLPAALDELGHDAVHYSRNHKTYRDHTFKLRESHAHQVVPRGQAADIIFHDKNGDTAENVAADSGKVRLFLFARQYYGFFVEVVHGFDVMIGTFLRYRREVIRRLKK